MRRVAAVVVGMTLLVPPAACATSLRKQCRIGCGAAIDACVAEGGKRRRCKRQTLKQCRREGMETCLAATTTTTTVADATTTTVPAGSTTTLPAGGTTSTVPVETTTTTSLPALQGCTFAGADDRRDPAADRTITFVNYSYSPMCMRVKLGQSVTFVGGGGQSFLGHPLVGGRIISGTPFPDPGSPITPTSSGSSKTFVMTIAGTCPYYCDNHGVSQNMVGVVYVDP